MQGLITHFRALDGWRGLCALIVALYHFPGSGLLEQNRLVGNAEFFVDFFFVLSGFVIAANYLHRIGDERAALRFMGLRIGRLYPLHFATFIAFFLFECLSAFIDGFGRAFNETNSLITIPSTLLLIQSWGLHNQLSWNWPSWSISCEMAAYGVFALITLFYSGRARYLMFAALIFLSLVLLWRLSGARFLSTWDYGMLRCFAGFFAGVFAWKTWSILSARAASLPAFVMTLLESLAALLALGFVWLNGAGQHWQFAAPFIFAITVTAFSFDRGALSRFLQHRFFQWLGLLSYSIYMVHAFLAVRIANLFDALGARLQISRTEDPDGGYSYALAAVPGEAVSLAFTALVLAVSALTYRLIEVPGRDLVRRWLDGNSRTAASA